MKITYSQLLPKLKTFVERTIKKQQRHIAFTEMEVKALTQKYFPKKKRETVVQTKNDFGENYFNATFRMGTSRVHGGLYLEFIVAEHYALERAEIRIAGNCLEINYIGCDDQTYCCPDCHHAPKHLKRKMISLARAVSTKRGPTIKIPLPHPVSFLSIPQLGCLRLGFVGEVVAYKKKILSSMHQTQLRQSVTLQKDGSGDDY